MIKQSLEKRLIYRVDATIMSNLARVKYPAVFMFLIGMSMGFWQLNWLYLKEHNNRLDGTNKNVFEVCRWSHLW